MEGKKEFDQVYFEFLFSHCCQESQWTEIKNWCFWRFCYEVQAILAHFKGSPVKGDILIHTSGIACIS